MAAGRVSGYPDGSFKPDNKVTRAEFVIMVNGIIDYI
ncbi:MAG: S-layer homology domain-containing protein [Bacillota bacterium]|nr:S-layer homology domain-containing protein [Bacillota bacterium]HRC80750.1 S-layer homology domain-containing protein [Sedimentibacter sp.]